jgi:hypothetical protein
MATQTELRPGHVNDAPLFSGSCVSGLPPVRQEGRDRARVSEAWESASHNALRIDLSEIEREKGQTPALRHG